MTRSLLYLLLLLTALQACVSGSRHRLALAQVEQLKTDSTLLAKRNRMLIDEKIYLENKSATIEQSLNQRLQEKEDSIDQKEALLRQHELSINDMKARKAEERDAFGSLSASVAGLFNTYSASEVNAYTNCTQILVEVSDRLLFIPGSTKADPQAARILAKVAEALVKNPDLNLLIVAHTDSAGGVKEKYEDNWALGAMKANALVRAMIREQKVKPEKVASSSRAETIALPIRKGAAGLSRSRISFVFYSDFLPCIHSKE
jgi:flagellar motor protein MotB